MRLYTHTHTHTHTRILLKNEKNTRAIETVVNNAVLVCHAKINEKLNRYLNNKKYINSSNILCKITKILENNPNIYCDSA